MELDGPGLQCCPFEGHDGEADARYYACCDNTNVPTIAPTTLAPTPWPTPGACANGVKDGDETGVDCGGPACHPCGQEEPCKGVPGDCPCKESRDCASGLCVIALGNLGFCMTGFPTPSPTFSPGLCELQPGCVAAGLTSGSCCPAADRFTYFSCCDFTPKSATPIDLPGACSLHPRCVDAGLSVGLCCPSGDGVSYMPCCDNTNAPTTPTADPTAAPSASPSAPSAGPSSSPSSRTRSPTDNTATPSVSPTTKPSHSPSPAPTTQSPTAAPTASSAILYGGIGGGAALLFAATACLVRHRNKRRKAAGERPVSSGDAGIELTEPGRGVETVNPMHRNKFAKRSTMDVASWAKARKKVHREDSQMIVRQPSNFFEAYPMPKHLAHGHTATHRKNYKKDRRTGNTIKMKADDESVWHLAEDPDSGNTYWYNEATHKSSWTNPNEQQDEPGGHNDDVATIANRPAAAAPAEESNHTAVGPWEQVTDDNSLDPYWWNRDTGETRWTAPPEVSARKWRKAKTASHSVIAFNRASADGELRDLMRRAEPGRHNNNDEGDDGEHLAIRDSRRKKKKRTLVSMPSTEDAGLPDGWSSFTDPKTGATYFASATGETSWTKPGQVA